MAVKENYEYQVSVILPVYKKIPLIDAVLDSVFLQTRKTQLVIADATNIEGYVQGVLDTYMRRLEMNCCRDMSDYIGPNTVLVKMPKEIRNFPGMIKNAACEYASGKFVVFLEPGDLLWPDLSENIARCNIEYPDTEIITCDFSVAYYDSRTDCLYPDQSDYAGHFLGGALLYASHNLCFGEHAVNMSNGMVWPIYRIVHPFLSSYVPVIVKKDLDKNHRYFIEEFTCNESLLWPAQTVGYKETLLNVPGYIKILYEREYVKVSKNEMLSENTKKFISDLEETIKVLKEADYQKPRRTMSLNPYWKSKIIDLQDANK